MPCLHRHHRFWSLCVVEVDRHLLCCRLATRTGSPRNQVMVLSCQYHGCIPPLVPEGPCPWLLLAPVTGTDTGWDVMERHLWWNNLDDYDSVAATLRSALKMVLLASLNKQDISWWETATQTNLRRSVYSNHIITKYVKIESHHPIISYSRWRKLCKWYIVNLKTLEKHICIQLIFISFIVVSSNINWTF